VDTFKNLQVNRLYIVQEGAKSPQSVVLSPLPPRALH